MRTPSGGRAGVRADFPIFAREFDGRPLVYLDTAATSQKPAVVIEAVAEHLRNHNANVHRGVYALAQEADAAYDGARRRLAAWSTPPMLPPSAAGAALNGYSTTPRSQSTRRLLENG